MKLRRITRARLGTSLVGWVGSSYLLQVRTDSTEQPYLLVTAVLVLVIRKGAVVAIHIVTSTDLESFQTGRLSSFLNVCYRKFRFLRTTRAPARLSLQFAEDY